MAKKTIAPPPKQTPRKKQSPAKILNPDPPYPKPKK